MQPSIERRLDLPQQLTTADVHIFTSLPGVGRQYTLNQQLKRHWPGQYVIVDATRCTSGVDLSAALLAETPPSIIVFDGLSYTTDHTQDAALRLMIDGTVPKVPVKYLEPVTPVIPEHVTYILSETITHDTTSDVDEFHRTLEAAGKTVRRENLSTPVKWL